MSFKRVLLLILSLLASKYSESGTISIPDVTDDCLVIFDSINTTFNLCSSRIDASNQAQINYVIEDTRNINNQDNTNNNHYYKYYFNIGGAVPSIHPICFNMSDGHNGYCADEENCTQNTELIAIQDPAWSYQVWFNASTHTAFRCYHLSNEFGGPPIWSLFHVGDPSLGVKVTYNNGDHFGCNGNRKFTIRFLCFDQSLFISDLYPLYEYTECEYTLELRSIYGCPQQCKPYQNKSCLGNGICGFDWTNNAPRCFCYHQWSGVDCSVPDTFATLPTDAVKIPPKSPFIKNFHIEETNIDVAYDLRPFAIESEIYVVNNADYRKNHTYYVGVPDPVLPPSMGGTVLPKVCDDIIQPCAHIDNSTRQCVDGTTYGTNYGFIFQLNTDTNECLNLGTEIEWALYDIDNPAGGITLTYYDGSWCPSGGKNMEMKLHFLCPKDQDSVYHPRNETEIDLYEYVEEDDNTGCSYSFTYFTAVACPYQCVSETLHGNIETFTVCQRKGVCAADPNAGFVRCLCDNGWTGIDCQKIVTANPTVDPTQTPTFNPTAITISPSVGPTQMPTFNPTQPPTFEPSQTPTFNPTEMPTFNPTQSPTTHPTTHRNIDTTQNLDVTPVQTNDVSRSVEVARNSITFLVLVIIWGTVVVVLICIGYCIFRKRRNKVYLQRISSTECNEASDVIDTAQQSLFDDNDEDFEMCQITNEVDNEETRLP